MTTQANDWAIGKLYIPNGGPGGFWKQPVPGGLVYPQQVTGNASILTVLPFNEKTGTYVFGCGHSVDYVTVYTDYDFTIDETVALLACPMCSFVQRAISPASDALMGSQGSLQNAILYP